jgi:hypothetical protein
MMDRVDSMSRGTVRFPNSVTMTLVDVPEQAALGFLNLGLAALGLAGVSRNLLPNGATTQRTPTSCCPAARLLPPARPARGSRKMYKP